MANIKEADQNLVIVQSMYHAVNQRKVTNNTFIQHCEKWKMANECFVALRGLGINIRIYASEIITPSSIVGDLLFVNFAQHGFSG